MATESPIRLTEANQKWISSKNSANFGQSSSTNMTVEDLGIIFNRKFRGESGNIPINRSESAPPSIEGSFASMEDLMAHKDSPLFGFQLSKNSPENFEYDPMNTRILPPLNSWENEHLFHLSTHKEEPEDDISSREGIVDQSQPKNPDTLRHENIAMNPSSSLSYESLEEAIDTPSSSSSINNPINTDPRTSLYNRRLSSPNVQLDVNVNESDVSNIEYGIKAMDIYGNMPHQQQQNYAYGPGPGPTPHYVHGPGPTTPLYATATTYMTSPAPLYQNPGYFNPQFITGGYAVNPVLHLPYLGGSSPHGGGFHGGASPSSGPIDTRQLNKFYGQLGFTINDPVNIQYFQDPYGFPSYGGPGSPFSPVPMIPDPKASPLGSSGHGPRRGGPYLGSPTNLGPFTQYQNSPSASPGLTGSRFSPFSQRNTGSYTGWNGPGQGPGLDDSTPLTLIEELKSGKGRRFELSDIAGHIVEFSADQHGSRFIQQKLEKCKPEEKESVFKEIHAHASKLMTDVFGNYVIQKFFEYGTTEQRKELADQLQGQILSLSFQMYGCRVIQKALEVIHMDQKVKLAEELNGHVMKCVRDQNGNHVIQKCIESIPSDKIQFIISSFHGEVAQLSTHPYGCRVIQRVLEHCTDQLQIQLIVDEILESVCDLAQNQYGNYVIQHVLGREKDDERRKIINKLSGRIVQLSQHKFASNVVEKCLEYGDSTSREILIQEIIGHDDGKDNLLVMMKDQYANYVVQKILHMCNESQREMLLSHIKDNQNTLKKFTYGKHIVSRVEQLYEEEN